ncbi:MAG: hypothetical protein K2P57_12365 [Burkholderiales bacterium]|nr:hypothetical protein [Burkholderiales bacterium]
MATLILFLLLLPLSNSWADDLYPGLQVDSKREGSVYTVTASFDTSLSKCAAYNYLTDYGAAKELPGVIESVTHRQSANEVKVERTADERILFFHVRIHSVMAYTEKPFDSISFTQLSGDSKLFKGHWEIEPNQHGSTLRFNGLWEPDTLIPDFVIDYFAKNKLADKFSAVAKLAEKHKSMLSTSCTDRQMLTLGPQAELASVHPKLNP